MSVTAPVDSVTYNPTYTFDPTTGTNAGGAAATPAAPTNAMLDRDAFLKLLVAQLKYQDPTKPVDASAMIGQSAQLSMVDQLSNIASSLERSGTVDKLSLAGSVVGKQIAFPDEEGNATTGVVEWVRFDPDGIVLGTGAWEVPYESVVAISAAPTTPTTPPTTTPTTPPADDTSTPPVDDSTTGDTTTPADPPAES